MWPVTEIPAVRRRVPFTPTGMCGLAAVMLVAAAARAGEVDVIVAEPSGVPAADAVVYAVPSKGGTSTSGKTVVVDQINREFVPHVTVIQTGTAVSFPNKDNIRHHVYSFSPAKTFNLKLYSGVPSSPVVFDKPGEVVLGCNIHDKMSAYVLVVDTPYFGRTDADGVARLKDVPPGDYAVSVWRPDTGVSAQPMPLRAKADTVQLRAALPPVGGSGAAPR